MRKPMRRPQFRARIQWHTWMPWYEFSRIVGEVQEHDERAGDMLPPALGIALVTLVAAEIVPQFSLLITVAGGGSIVWALTCATGDGRRLIRGVKVMGLPSPRTVLRLGAQMAADDVRTLWHGQSRLAGLLAGPAEEGWTRDETIGRYHLWRQTRESLSAADRTTAVIAAAVGFAHEELMDALLAHKLRLADLDAGRQQNLLAPILEVKMLEAAKASSTALVAVDAGGDNGTVTAEAGFNTPTGRDVAVCGPSHRDRQRRRLRSRHERVGGEGLGIGQCPPPICWQAHVSRAGQHQRRHDDLEAARGLIDAAAVCLGVGDGRHGDV